MTTATAMATKPGQDEALDRDIHAYARANSRKVFVKTYGCQMNVYDSERMEDALTQGGYVRTQNMEDADLVLLNTCHIREKAAEKVYSEIGRIRKLKEARKNTGKRLTLGVTGCVAQAEGEEIFRRAPAVDLIAGPQTYHDIAAMVARAENGEKVIETEFEIEEKFAKLPAPTRQQTIARGVAGFVTVQEGCDKFCTFCVVPYTRGAEVSRPFSQIADEALRMVDAGVREITLLGQNVNAWHGSDGGKAMRLGDLLYQLAEISGLERLRYTTSHPIDMDDGLIDAHRDIGKLMPYLHLPVQAGSDRILKAMNRHHTAAEYLDIIERVRKARPDIAISGDFITGFPGESDEDFEATMDIVRRVNYASAFSFKYSARPGTPGADMEDQVPEPVKSKRLSRLQVLLGEQQQAFNQACIGKTIDILVEKKGRHEGQLIGRSPWLQSVVVEGGLSEIGHMLTVQVTSSGPVSLMAERV
ncbi:tRNA (N6-isopentenyl adenosine(37)-C2)-methylthiotransferase MiaB [Salaquimonas pukyongi]|uniref:tRNA (N6-isopentenyl adenosine(37)-C2)-methylthiotransferase MiaB n=1 Tax=Salaquimonas pukyongi TaxID=2712698 RepID=UPI003D17E2F3